MKWIIRTYTIEIYGSPLCCKKHNMRIHVGDWFAVREYLSPEMRETKTVFAKTIDGAQNEADAFFVEYMRTRPQTRLDGEGRAYNTYGGGHSRSNRRGRALFADGKVRSVTAGIPDTFFSIPAHARIKGKYVSGFLTNDDGVWTFNLYNRDANKLEQVSE